MKLQLGNLAQSCNQLVGYISLAKCLHNELIDMRASHSTSKFTRKQGRLKRKFDEKSKKEKPNEVRVKKAGPAVKPPTS